MKVPNRIKRGLRWAIAAGALALALRQLISDPEALGRLWGTPGWVLACLAALVALNQALMSLRFSQIMTHMGAGGVGFVAWFRLTSVGQMLNLFVPQLGSVYRGVVLKRDYGISYLTWATGLISFVWLDMVGGVLIALAAIATFDPGLRFFGQSAVFILALTVSSIFIGPIAAAWVMGRLPPRAGRLGKLQHRLTSLLSTASEAARSPGLMARFFTLNVLVTLGHLTTFWLAFRSLGAATTLSQMMLFQVLIKLTNQVVITPGNLGITELAFGAVAHGSARALQQGIAVSLLLRAVSSTVTVLLGVLSGGVGALFGGRRAILEQADELVKSPEP